MYNEQIKSQFITEYSLNANVLNNCRYLFNATQEFEEKFDKDLYEMTPEMLAQTLSKTTGLQRSTRAGKISILRSYARWCLSRNFDNANQNILEYRQAEDNVMCDRMVSSPFHMQQFLDTICDAESKGSVDNVLRCYCWLLYGGCAMEDVSETRTSDVHLNDLTVIYKDSEIPIYREAIKAFQNCVYLDCFNYEHPLYSEDISRPRVESDMLLRSIRNVPTQEYLGHRLYEKITAHSKELHDFKITSKRICLSGLFYRMYERERAGFPADFHTIAQHQAENGGYVYEKYKNSLPRQTHLIEKCYKEDYLKWKLAFNK